MDSNTWCTGVFPKNIPGETKSGSRGERGNGELLVYGYSFCLDNDRVLEIDSGDNCTTL